MPRKPKGGGRPSPAEENFKQGLRALVGHPMFWRLAVHGRVYRHAGSSFPEDGWAIVTSDGDVVCHPKRLARPEHWTYVIAHALLHLGLGHFEGNVAAREWNVACCCFVAKFMGGLKLGVPPPDIEVQPGFAVKNERKLHEAFLAGGLPDPLPVFGTAGAGRGDMHDKGGASWPRAGAALARREDWRKALAEGIADAVASAVEVAGGRASALGRGSAVKTAAEAAMSWFMGSFPLLGALAGSFKLVEDLNVCRSLQVAVAAVDAELQEIYVNPLQRLDEQECRFVLAHELLHVGLRHQTRRRGRDPELWNVACDFVVNGWLLEMGVGRMPGGLLHDSALKGLSAEAVYDRIATDLRRYRKLATLRGPGLGDMLGRRGDGWWETNAGTALDDFYRRALSQGLLWHQEQGRGYLPAGLVEEVRALSQPPIPWDVELAEWFDDYFAPVARRRTYARPSRRQSATPDIPRPSWVPESGWRDGRTFGVLLDTSGSMDRKLLAKALGAIASYAIAREVPAVRVVFCDAAAYDEGYMAPEDIAGRVRIKGRGGTVLQPGVDLLERAGDFPKGGPLLIITDGQCDRLRVTRDHAFLLPRHRSLPFVPVGPVFRIH